MNLVQSYFCTFLANALYINPDLTDKNLLLRSDLMMNISFVDGGIASAQLVQVICMIKN